MRTVALAVGAVVIAGYPVAIWFSVSSGNVRGAAFILLVALAISLPFRMRGARTEGWSILGLPLTLAGLALLSMRLDDFRFMMAMPVLVNLTLLASFGASLSTGRTPMVERYARMIEPELPPGKVKHCRQATGAWVVFFATNATVSLALALFARVSIWALYTGAIAYALVAMMFGAEYAIRRVRFG